MIKCPNCGSTSQPMPINQVLAGSVYCPTIKTTYECGCGQKFSTLSIIVKKDETILNPNV